MNYLTALVFAAQLVGSGVPHECWYCAKPTDAFPQPEIERYENCAELVAGNLAFARVHLNRIVFDRHGLATALVGDQHYYIKPDGTMLAVITFDNWADIFSEGLVRSRIDGKMAYFDRQFWQAIPPRYDWGAPFENGRALVCKGCTVQEADDDGHRPVTGGVWGYVNRQGIEVVPVSYTQDEVRRM